MRELEFAPETQVDGGKYPGSWLSYPDPAEKNIISVRRGLGVIIRVFLISVFEVSGTPTKSSIGQQRK